MDDPGVLKSILNQIPGLGCLVFLVIMALRYLKERDTLESDRNKTVAAAVEKMCDAVCRNTTEVSRITSAIDNFQRNTK